MNALLDTLRDIVNNCSTSPDEEVDIRMTRAELMHVCESLATLNASPGAARIAKERAEHVRREGWTPEHDDEHAFGELALAGTCYARYAANSSLSTPRLRERYSQVLAPVEWPWHPSWWKPKNPLRDYERAGALIAAEMDKLIRHNKGGTDHDGP